MIDREAEGSDSLEVCPNNLPCGIYALTAFIWAILCARAGIHGYAFDRWRNRLWNGFLFA